MIPVNCLNCINYIDDLKCAAFPEKIPDEILEGDNMHKKPLPDQGNDIVFTPIKKGK
jgi:hypothetical protein